MTSSPAEQADAAHAGRGARLEFADVGRHEADRLAVAGGEQDVVALGQQLDPDQPVGRDRPAPRCRRSTLGHAEAHRDLAGGRNVGEGGHAVAADGAVRGREHDVQAAPFGLVLGQREDGRDGLALGQREQIDHRPALGVGAALGQPPHLHPVDPAEVGEEQHRIVGRGDEQVGDRILFLGRHAGAALAAALLLAEHRQRRALDVAGHGHGHDHVLALDQILVLDAVGGGRQSRSCAESRIRLRPRRTPRASPRRGGRGWRGFRAIRRCWSASPSSSPADLVAAERGQAVEAKLEDRLHLRFGQAVASRAWPAARPPRPAGCRGGSGRPAIRARATSRALRPGSPTRGSASPPRRGW